MQIGELFGRLVEAAQRAYDGREARAVAEFILERRFGADRLAVVLEPAKEVDTVGLDRVLIELADARPVQYIAGEAWFDGMWLGVGQGVLVPRPETEELVRWVADEVPRGSSVLDVGTGSGAIAIALARRGMRVTGIDISDAALAVARENARRMEVDIVFERCDILNEKPHGVYDVIVSNPPYIPASAKKEMHRNVVAHEPGEALFVPDDDPLIFYRAIAEAGVGELFFEIYERPGDRLCDMLRDKGYAHTEIRNDLGGRPRTVHAQKP